MSHPGGDGLPFIYSGTLFTRGQAMAKVLATGVRAEIGRIGVALSGGALELTPLQQQVARVIRHIAALAIALAATLALLYGTLRGGWLDATLAGITLAMSILPQEFPVVLTVFLALGAWRIAKQRVLTRRIPEIETLGAATVLCVDKTGTLTLNRMAVRALVANGEWRNIGGADPAPLPAGFHSLVEISILASEADPHDPMERAFHEFGRDALLAAAQLHKKWKLVREYPITGALLAHGHGWVASDGTGSIVAAKGAPETLVMLCRLSDSQRAELVRQASALAVHGLRVLAVARAPRRSRMARLTGRVRVRIPRPRRTCRSRASDGRGRDCGMP